MIKATDVMELRKKTGVSMMKCKEALVHTDGDIEQAKLYLRKEGVDISGKISRDTNEGVVESYIHTNGSIGVLIEVNCETDFAAKSSKFKDFVKDIAMHIAATNSKYISKEDVPQDIVDKEKAFLINQAMNQGKPEHIAEKIVSGRIRKYYEEICLLEQPFVKDTTRLVKEILAETISIIGENITIKRFTYYKIGG